MLFNIAERRNITLRDSFFWIIATFVLRSGLRSSLEYSSKETRTNQRVTKRCVHRFQVSLYHSSTVCSNLHQTADIPCSERIMYDIDLYLYEYTNTVVGALRGTLTNVATGGLSLLRRALDISNSTIVPPRKWPQVIVVLMCTRDVPGSNLCWMREPGYLTQYILDWLWPERRNFLYRQSK